MLYSLAQRIYDSSPIDAIMKLKEIAHASTDFTTWNPSNVI